MCDHRSGTSTLGGLSLKLKQAEHFEDDDDNDDDSDDVEDVSIHGSWITRRYPSGKQFTPRNNWIPDASHT
jgi:hypothetical protein